MNQSEKLLSTMSDTYTLTFHGGVGRVTGANFLLEKRDGTTLVLVDCGLIQGMEKAEMENYKSFAFDPSTIDALFVTHAHLDHIGRIPKLVRDGFSGMIYSTPATKELAEISFEDALSIMREDVKRGRAKEMLYEPTDVERALSLWKTLEYHESISVGELRVKLKDAGHILGSSMVEVAGGEQKIVFTGDLGNSPAPLLKKTETVDDARYILMESVYGDRNHENVEERSEKLFGILKKTVDRGGTVVIPAFSLERTQILLHEINHFIEEGKLKKVPVFLDSPLAIKMTEVYEHYKKLYNAEVQKDFKSGDHPFSFPGLVKTETHEDSKGIKAVGGPKIIIAGSGMSDAGRVIYHEKEYLAGRKNTLLIVGFQSAGSLGRQLQEGVKKVKIDGQTVRVKASVETIHGFSAHADMDALFSFAETAAKTAKTFFVAMGEPKSGQFFAQRLRDYLDIEAIYPKEGASYEIEL